MEEKPKYNVERHRRTTIRFTMRGVISFYLLYLAWGLAKGSREKTSVPQWLLWAMCGLFVVVAVGFAAYAYKQYKIGLKDAEVRPEDELPETDGQDESEDAP